MNIGNAIKTIRTEKGISQKKLAELCELSTTGIRNIEKGKSNPSKKTISKIAESLKVPTSYILLFSITEEDIPEEKRILYNQLCKPFQEDLKRCMKE